MQKDYHSSQKIRYNIAVVHALHAPLVLLKHHKLLLTLRAHL